MKRLMIAVALAGAVSLGACATQPPVDTPAPSNSALTSYTWKLASGPASLTNADNVVMTFGKDGRVSLAGLCNRMSGGFTESGATVTITQMASTMMACADNRLSNLEREVGGGIQGPHSMMMTRSEPPQLNMKMQSGQTWIFRGQR